MEQGVQEPEKVCTTNNEISKMVEDLNSTVTKKNIRKNQYQQKCKSNSLIYIYICQLPQMQ